MKNEEIRLKALRVLNKHFKHEGKFGCLEDRQVKLVLDAMIDFRQISMPNISGSLPTKEEVSQFARQRADGETEDKTVRSLAVHDFREGAEWMRIKILEEEVKINLH